MQKLLTEKAQFAQINQNHSPAKATKMDYFSILNLNKEPFSNSPDPEFFFHSRQHLDCLQKLELSLLLRRGLNVIIGDVGTGKTTMCRHLIRRFAQKEEMETYLILDPHFVYAAEFLGAVAKLLTGKKPPAGSPDWQVKEYLKQHLFRKGVDQGKTIVLIIDEGQKIPAFCLEILREFLNYETNEYKLLQIVIFAQREFGKTVRKYPNFADRISLYHLLKPLSFLDTRRMIRFRLGKSTSSRPKLNLFTYPALWAIFRITGGYPRKIINLCHQSILSMIIQNRSKIGYFLIRTCARRVFPGESRRRKILFTAALMGGAAAVMLLILLPLDRFQTLQLRALPEIKTELSQKPTAETMVSVPEETLVPVPKEKPPAVKARMAPGGFDMTDRIETEPGPPAPVKAAKPAKSEKADNDTPIVAPAETESLEMQPELAPAPTYAEILGRITLKRNETLSRIIRQVYGGFSSSYLKSFIVANPDIEDPDRVEVGRIIALPAIPVAVKPGDKRVRWIKVDESDTLEDAFKILRNHPGSLPPVRLIPYWNPVNGTKFAVVLNKVFKDEFSARSQQQLLPTELLPRSEILSLWDKTAVYFANPYFDRAH